jgi:RNA polymerase sigma factor (sigma-70 family)
MTRDLDAWLPTRRSLLSRLKDWEDQDSWRDFFTTYWKLIYGVAIKAGLRESEAEEVVQETVLSIAKKMGEFVYDPTRCTFKGWLLHVTRLRILDQFRKRGPLAFQNSLQHKGSSDGTATVEGVPDPASLTLDAIWEEEWEKNLIDAALERVKKKVKPEHYQIFYLLVVKELPVPKVAKMLGVSSAQVYLVKHRVAALVKKEIKNLNNEALK